MKQDLIAAVSASEDALELLGVQATRTAREAVEKKLAGLNGRDGREASWKEFEACCMQASGSKGVGSIRAHLAVLAVWIFMAIIYNGIIFLQKGTDVGLEWFSGYILEWLLSMDNVFIFHLIFQSY